MFVAISMLAVMCAVAHPAHAAPLASNTTQGSSNRLSALLPFANMPEAGSYTFDDDPRIHYSLDEPGKEYFEPQIDTGSCGVMLGARKYPNFRDQRTQIEQQTPGHQYLSSSQYLYHGYWVPNTIYLNQGAVVASVPILVVTKTVQCLDYDNTQPGYCRTINQTVCDVDQPRLNCNTSYFGVGFGREYDGQDQGTPDKNPFLNIKSISGAPVTSSNYNIGYSITAAGVTVGTDPSNPANYSLVGLDPYQSRTSDLDWQQPPGCLQVTDNNGNTGSCVSSKILLDTGIDKSFAHFTSASGSYVGQSPWTDGKFHTVAPGWTFKVNFGTSSDVEASFSFTTGSEGPSTPTKTQAKLDTSSGALGFLNTGRYFYKTHDILFDAANGKFGIRAHS